MSNRLKKSKKGKLKIKKGKKSTNENFEDIILSVPQITSSLQILNSINNEMDSLSDRIKYNKYYNIFKNEFASNYVNNQFNTPLINNNNYFYDKEDIETKILLNKANAFLNNNNFQKQFIKKYENKITQSDDNYYNNNIDKYRLNSTNFSFFNNDFNKKRIFNFKRGNNNNNFINNYNIGKRKSLNKTNDFYKFPTYDFKINKPKKNIKKYFLRNSFDKDIIKRTKKLEDINSYISNYKRKPLVYSQPYTKREYNNIEYKLRNFSDANKYHKFKGNFKQYLRRNDDDKAIDILKYKI